MGVNLRPREPRCSNDQEKILAKRWKTKTLEGLISISKKISKNSYSNSRVILTNVMSRYLSFVFVPSGRLKLYFRYINWQTTKDFLKTTIFV
ncbi:hypothetical protein NC651_024488 [Populus alba x Populus x berolinensis]|nr:hypothetical protein NC651_024488 [Populus alba x Populus x berolinensis]